MPSVRYVIARGREKTEDERRLLRRQGIVGALMIWTCPLGVLTTLQVRNKKKNKAKSMSSMTEIRVRPLPCLEPLGKNRAGGAVRLAGVGGDDDDDRR